MGIFTGIDIGTVSIKLAAVGTENEQDLFKRINEHSGTFFLCDDIGESVKNIPVLFSRYKRLKGSPARAVLELLKEFFKAVPMELVEGIRVTGMGSMLASRLLNTERENEFKAITRGVSEFYPSTRTLFEMGGETSKYIRFENDSSSGKLGIADYETNGDCAAGTGSFIDQQATRLKYSVEDLGEIVLEAERTAAIAGRCSVFAKSDMIHAQQKGYTPPEVLKGLCEAVARNFKGAITKGKPVKPMVLFVGGVAHNAGVVQAMKTVFDISDESLRIPPYPTIFGALGAALIEKESDAEKRKPFDFESLKNYDAKLQSKFPVSDPLDMSDVVLLRDRVQTYSFDGKELPVRAYLGLDIGSVSTNLVVLDEHGDLIKEIYLRTQARPIQVVYSGLDEIQKEIGSNINILGVGTTGSGRELIGELVGADTVNDEITCHKTGAEYVSEKLIGGTVDTIFEIGGQDSKYISIDDHIVVDFTMNEACAAGTGSFLEEQAEKLGISIYNQFAELAFQSRKPVRLGERCTVFMERDVSSFQQRGAEIRDLVAGLAYSVALNYLNRVVRGRKIGSHIFFQGGTAYNDSVAAAFSKILKMKITVPPHNGVIGAIGAALLAKEKMERTDEPTRFHGYKLEDVQYSTREFTCKGCTNYCDIQEFTVENEKTYWGDKCSERYRKRAKTEKKAVIPDLFKLRRELMLGYMPEQKKNVPVIGIPLSMYTFDRLPFWTGFLDELGLAVELSDFTNRKIARDGEELIVAEQCYPVKIAHGHIRNLIDKKVDFIFVPNMVNNETNDLSVESHVCPWGQTLPFVLKNTPEFHKYLNIFLTPTVHFREGQQFVARQLLPFAKTFGASQKTCRRAVARAYFQYRDFQAKLTELGREHLEYLRSHGEKGIVLIGRPYNLHDGAINLELARKLRDYYGVNVIPMDCVPVGDAGINDINENMYWNYGRKILAIAKNLRNYPDIHLIYITNFKCGPDSYIKHFTQIASQKPYLTLQFDGHSNDAGMMTRCEAYLDSKGFLRWWKQLENKI